MLASDCFPQEMVDEERSLIVGACACGNLKPDARTRVIPILSHEAAPMRDCIRAGYLSLVSVPVRLQQRLIGERRRTKYLSPSDFQTRLRHSEFYRTSKSSVINSHAKLGLMLKMHRPKQRLFVQHLP
jgi:hypothetical protein